MIVRYINVHLIIIIIIQHVSDIIQYNAKSTRHKRIDVSAAVVDRDRIITGRSCRNR